MCRAPFVSLACLFVLRLFLSGLASAQAAPAHAATAAAQTFAAEPYVVVHLGDTYTMKADGTGTREFAGEIRAQSQAGLKEVSVLRIGFASRSQSVEWLFVRLHHSDGSTSETPVSGAIEVAEAVTREAPLYSDLKESQMPVRDLRVGDTVEWKARVTRTAAEAPGQFWAETRFTSSGVVLSETLELRMPKDMALTFSSPKFKPTDATEGDLRVLRWESTRLTPTVGPAADAAKAAEEKRVRTPAEELDERQGKLPDVAWTTFKSWAEVGAWYRKLEGDRTARDDKIRAKVLQLTAGKTTESEKAQAVYAYVALQIHYIGVDFGIGRYQPHGAADVLDNQFGDCKDKHTLLAAMLQTLGLHPEAVLIGAGIRFNETVPSPGNFNHLITRVAIDGKPVWLDATAETAPFGMLLYVIRDRSALVVPDDAPATVLVTAARAPVPQTLTMHAVGKLDQDGNSESTMTMAFRGDAEVTLRGVLRQISPAQYDELAKNLFASMGYSGTGTLVETSRPEDTSGPFEITLTYKRTKAGDWENLRTIPQLLPAQLPVPDEKNPPVESIVLGVPQVLTSDSAMTLPEGWTAELPEAVHEKSPWAIYDLTYSFKNGVLHAERRVEVLEERVPQAEWKSYAKFAGHTSGEPYIQLVRHTPGKRGKKDTAEYTPGTGPKTAGPDEEATATPESEIADALAALRLRDTAHASALLDQAKKQKPEETGLWLGYGYLAFAKGEITEAASNFDKEATLHPSNVDAYRMLAYMQTLLKHKPEVHAALERWAEAAPDDAEPRRQEAVIAMEANQPEEAVHLLEPFVTHPAAATTPDEYIVLLLGRAQLQAGHREASDATLLMLLKTTDNPDIMNDTAYELADAGLELKAADEATASALTRLEAESRAWTLDENLQTVVARSRMLAATWDTMGWILFREGQAQRADQYIHAAWQDRQDLEVGVHLGEIALARGEKGLALTDFGLALATDVGHTDALGIPAVVLPKHEKVSARAADLRKAGIKPVADDGSGGLQKLRTLQLGAGEKGVAEYKLLIGPGGTIVRAEPTGSSQVPGAKGLFERTRLPSLMPPGEQAQLVVVAVLNCHGGRCELVLEP